MPTDLDENRSTPPLRPYQERAVASVLEQFGLGRRAVALVAPTGSGKTRMAASVARWVAGRTMLVAHRQELLDQAVRVMPANVSCFSLQTLARRKHAPDVGGEGLVILDEMHHVVSTPVWGWIGEEYHRRGTRILGLSATPLRQDGAALGSLFDALIVAAQVKELTEHGWLVPARVIGPPTKQQAMAEDPVTAWRTWGGDRRAIVFCRDVAHAKSVAAAFCASGIPSTSVEGQMPEERRREAFADFRMGRLSVLCNVQICTEGWDSPEVGCVILARGCSHAGSFLQIVGRALRPSPGKTEATIIDLCGSCHEWGLPSDERVYSLEGKAIGVKESLLPIRQCPSCGGVCRSAEYVASRCPLCGAALPVRRDPAIRRAELAEIRSTHTVGERARVLRELVARGRSLGRKPGWALYLWKARYHRWPSAQERREAGL